MNSTSHSVAMFQHMWNRSNETKPTNNDVLKQNTICTQYRWLAKVYLAKEVNETAKIASTQHSSGVQCILYSLMSMVQFSVCSVYYTPLPHFSSIVSTSTKLLLICNLNVWTTRVWCWCWWCIEFHHNVTHFNTLKTIVNKRADK